jgi:hypothetical protein
MFATYFEWKVKAGREEDFVQAWTEVTKVLRAEDSLGSTLFKDKTGHFHALARWPDQATRDVVIARHIRLDARAILLDCIDVEIQRVDMDQVENLWIV